METLNSSSPVLLEAKQISHNFDYPLFENIDLTLHEELKLYLEYLKVADVEGTLKEFNDLKVV